MFSIKITNYTGILIRLASYAPKIPNLYYSLMYSTTHILRTEVN